MSKYHVSLSLENLIYCRPLAQSSTPCHLCFLFLISYPIYFCQVEFTVWLARYELFVGQPPFYTNSVYALIRHIVKVTSYLLILFVSFCYFKFDLYA
jgi:hypothetical protein